MPKIVIIEDNLLIAKLYETNLTADHTVRTASDGVDGLKLVEEFKPDVLLLDLMISEISGPEIIMELRKHPKFMNLPILAYSGDEELLDIARQAGATSVFSKKESSLKNIISSLEAILTPPDKCKPLPLREKRLPKMQKKAKMFRLYVNKCTSPIPVRVKIKIKVSERLVLSGESKDVI